MPNYTAPSSRLLLVVVLGACSCSLLGCSLFEPESDWECFNPDCSAVESGVSGSGAGGDDADVDAGRSGSSGGSSGSGGTSGIGGTDGGAGSACMECDADKVCDEVGGECVQCLGNEDCESSAPVCTVD